MKARLEVAGEKDASEEHIAEDDDMFPVYDFTGGVCGKHHEALREGYPVMIHQADGTTLVQQSLSILDLTDVRALADHLHAIGRSYHDSAWGWEVTYEPELDEPDAEVQVPDGRGGFRSQMMPLWTPASFTIGESGVWFFSLLWENGSDKWPVEFLDDRNVVEHA